MFTFVETSSLFGNIFVSGMYCSVSLPVSPLEEFTIVNANKTMKMDPILLLWNPAHTSFFFFDIAEL